MPEWPSDKNQAPSARRPALADIPAPAWHAYRQLRERMEAARGTDAFFEAATAVMRWEVEACGPYGPPTVANVADLLLRVGDTEWAEGQIRHLQHQLDETRRERDSLRRELAAVQARPCGESGQ